MYKVIVLVSRKPGMSRADFQRHYETVHVPLVKTLVPALVEYRRNFFDPVEVEIMPGAEAPDFDCITEMWFKDRAGFEALTEINNDPVKGMLLAEDALKFMDPAKTRLMPVGEFGGPI